MANISSVLGRIRVTGRRTPTANAVVIPLHRTAVLPPVVAEGEGSEQAQPARHAVPPPRRPVEDAAPVVLGSEVHLDAAGTVDLRDSAGSVPVVTVSLPAPVFESEQGAWLVEPGTDHLVRVMGQRSGPRRSGGSPHAAGCARRPSLPPRCRRARHAEVSGPARRWTPGAAVAAALPRCAGEPPR